VRKEELLRKGKILQLLRDVIREGGKKFAMDFLRFVTGGTQIPKSGIRVEFVESKNFLPTAHACFKILELKDYVQKHE